MPATYSTRCTDRYVYGDSWPRWQRNLYPVTYERDAGKVREVRAQLAERLQKDRHQLGAYLKSGDAHLVRFYRKEVDRLARYVRNCDTQLRLIDNARPKLHVVR